MIWNTFRVKPTHVSACGYQTGLTLFVNPEPNDYAAAILGSYGVKVTFHFFRIKFCKNSHNSVLNENLKIPPT